MNTPKKIFSLLFVIIIFVIKIKGQVVDDIYYSPKDDKNAIRKIRETPPQDQQQRQQDYNNDNNNYSERYQDNNGNTYINNNYYGDDDYYYSSRLRRFHNSYSGFGYYSNCYVNPYWYDYDPFWWGLSYGFGYYPGFSMRLSYGYSPWDYGYSNYNPWSYGYYNPYYSGFYDGYYYGNGGWGNKKSNIYYGHRGSTASNTYSGGTDRPRKNSGGTTGVPFVPPRNDNARPHIVNPPAEPKDRGNSNPPGRQGATLIEQSKPPVNHNTLPSSNPPTRQENNNPPPRNEPTNPRSNPGNPPPNTPKPRHEASKGNTGNTFTQIVGLSANRGQSNNYQNSQTGSYNNSRPVVSSSSSSSSGGGSRSSGTSGSKSSSSNTSGRHR